MHYRDHYKLDVIEQASSFINLSSFHYARPNADADYCWVPCRFRLVSLRVAQLPGEGAVAVSILNMEMKMALIAYFTNVHKNQICPLPNRLPCRLSVVLCVSVFIYPFQNYLYYSDIFPGLLALPIRAYFSLGWSILTSVPIIWLYYRQRGE